MTEKTATVHWEGPGKKGQRQITTETGTLKAYPYGFTRALASVSEITLQSRLLPSPAKAAP